jgi:hypothetical protein
MKLHVADDDNDEEWCCDSQHELASAVSSTGSNRRSSTTSSIRRSSCGDQAGIEPSMCAAGVQEEDWDNDTIEVTTEASRFDLDDGHRITTVALNHLNPTLADYKLNPFFCLPAVLHAHSYRSFKEQRQLVATSSHRSDISQFDDADS